MRVNTNLRSSKIIKNDEFYTQLKDIENELSHYKKHFKDKVVYCNCDNPQMSNFYVYFKTHFNELGLKKLITTYYHPTEAVYKLETTQNSEVKTPLRDNGDFRSQECIETLREADIVVTNPPFSLFREYVAQLIEHDKKFIIIGNLNAVTYREIYSLMMDNKIWMGFNTPNTMFFMIPNDSQTPVAKIDDKGNKYASIKGMWFSNLKIEKQYKCLPLSEKYDEKKYRKYDNYDAIEVGRVKDIPIDYKGVMGVPITFLSKYNPEQFEIVRFRKGNDNNDLSINGKCPYFRILIRAK